MLNVCTSVLVHSICSELCHTRRGEAHQIALQYTLNTHSFTLQVCAHDFAKGLLSILSNMNHNSYVAISTVDFDSTPSSSHGSTSLDPSIKAVFAEWES